MKELGKKGVLLLVAIILLGCALLGLSFAWYTKMTSASAVSFHLARWDFNAKVEIDSFEVDVYPYKTITGKNLAAPGTEGILAIELGALESDTDVAYSMFIDKSTMADEFKRRIFFFVNEKDGEGNVTVRDLSSSEDLLEGTITAGSETEVEICWRWVYDYDEFLERQSPDEFKVLTVLKSLSDTDFDLLITNNSPAALDSITISEEDAKILDDFFKGSRNYNFKKYWNDYKDAYEAHDDFDTQVGEHTALYEPQMTAIAYITGAEAKPVLDD